MLEHPQRSPIHIEFGHLHKPHDFLFSELTAFDRMLLARAWLPDR